MASTKAIKKSSDLATSQKLKLERSTSQKKKEEKDRRLISLAFTRKGEKLLYEGDENGIGFLMKAAEYSPKNGPLLVRHARECENKREALPRLCAKKI